MGMDHGIGTASVEGADRVMAALVAGLELEFGRGAGEALARRFLDAEDADFLWAARREERWLGGYDSVDDEDFDLDRIAVYGRLDGRWYVGVLLVDGNGTPHGLLGKRYCRSGKSARAALADAH